MIRDGLYVKWKNSFTIFCVHVLFLQVRVTVRIQCDISWFLQIILTRTLRSTSRVYQRPQSTISNGNDTIPVFLYISHIQLTYDFIDNCVHQPYIWLILTSVHINQMLTNVIPVGFPGITLLDYECNGTMPVVVIARYWRFYRQKPSMSYE